MLESVVARRVCFNLGLLLGVLGLWSITGNWWSPLLIASGAAIAFQPGT